MASMTSLKYVLDPFSPLNGDVTERWRAEPTVGKISVCFREDDVAHTGFESRRSDAQFAYILICHGVVVMVHAMRTGRSHHHHQPQPQPQPS